LAKQHHKIDECKCVLDQSIRIVDVNVAMFLPFWIDPVGVVCSDNDPIRLDAYCVKEVGESTRRQEWTEVVGAWVGCVIVIVTVDISE
jgi:hypothetical protein